MTTRNIDISGEKFGSLVVSRYLGYSKWECVCSCGNLHIVRADHLKTGRTKTCGNHGLTKRPEYKVWKCMKGRVLCVTNKNYKDYGGRGIDIDPRWIVSFETFLADVGPRPDKSFSLDRIDNDRGYWPDNVRWATKVEQRNNRRDTKKIVVS